MALARPHSLYPKEVREPPTINISTVATRQKKKKTTVPPAKMYVRCHNMYCPCGNKLFHCQKFGKNNLSTQLVSNLEKSLQQLLKNSKDRHLGKSPESPKFCVSIYRHFKNMLFKNQTTLNLQNLIFINLHFHH